MKHIFLLLFMAAFTQVLRAQDGKVNQRAQPVLEQKPAMENNDQQFSLYEKKWLIRDRDTLPYRLLYPENYDPKKKYPLIVFLHGSGERGRDNEKQLLHGGDLFIRADVRKNYPAIVIFPQCPESDSWARYRFEDSNGTKKFLLLKDEAPTASMLLLESLVAGFQKMPSVDQNRIYIGGLSMGGMGTFEIARRHPDLFAAAFPICGAGDPSSAHELRKINWWIFHGAKDNVVPPSCSATMAEALLKEKAPVQFTLYPEANHNSWDSAFAEPKLMSWLFAQRKLY